MKTVLMGFVVAAFVATSGTAGAQEEGDGVRFRGGIALEGGAMVLPNLTLGAIGPTGHLGVQINNLIGVYAVPGFDVLFGPAGGVDFYAAVLVDFTFLHNYMTVGVGPDFGAFVALGGSTNSTGTAASASVAGGAQYGGRLRVAFNPVWSIGENGVRRKALVIALEARFLIGPAASATATASSTSTGSNSSSESVSDTAFTFIPTLSIGYEAF